MPPRHDMTEAQREELRQKYTKPEKWPKQDIIAWLRSIGVKTSWMNVMQWAAKYRAAGEDWTRTAVAVQGWSLPRALGPPPRINPGGGILCFSDAHIPCHDANWMNRIFDLAHEWGITAAISNGDMFNLDSMTRWQRQEVGYEDEKKASGQAATAITDEFGLDIILGNHCLRIAREMNWRVPPDEAIREFIGVTDKDGRVRVRRHKCAILYNSYRIEHSKRSSMMACQVAHNLCAQYRTNAVTAHAHVWGMIGDMSGKNVAIDMGHCADMKKMDYTQRETFGRTQYAQGALILQPDEDGIVRPWLLSPLHSDFKALRALGPHFRAVNKERYGGGSVRPPRA